MEDKKLNDLLRTFDAPEEMRSPRAYHYPQRNSRKPRGNKVGLILLMVILGAGTLGIGVGVGYGASNFFAEEAPAVVQAIEPAADVMSLRLTPAPIQINPSEPSFADIIPEIKDAVVSIRVTNAPIRGFGSREGTPGSGSGFIFYQDEEFVFVATNNHVIENANAVYISLDDDENTPAQVIGTDRYSDLAVLAVAKADLHESGIPFAIAPLGDSDIMRMGEPVVAIGNSLGEGQIVTMGIVSALNLQITIDDPGSRTTLTLDVMQTDAAVNRGNSGGPLINQHGEVIGIVTAKLFGADIEGMGYALPINEAGEILMDLMETGSVRQPWIGIQHQEVLPYIRDMFNLPATGMLIREVFENTPAYDAGLQAFDLIAYFNGEEITSGYLFRQIILSHRPGDVVVLGIYRDHELINVELTLGSAMF